MARQAWTKVLVGAGCWRGGCLGSKSIAIRLRSGWGRIFEGEQFGTARDNGSWALLDVC